MHRSWFQTSILALVIAISAGAQAYYLRDVLQQSHEDKAQRNALIQSLARLRAASAIGADQQEFASMLSETLAHTRLTDPWLTARERAACEKIAIDGNTLLGFWRKASTAEQFIYYGDFAPLKSLGIIGQQDIDKIRDVHLSLAGSELKNEMRTGTRSPIFQSAVQNDRALGRSLIRSGLTVVDRDVDSAQKSGDLATPR